MSAKATAVSAARKLGPTTVSPAALLSEVRELILAARHTVAQGVNSALVLLYWQIGQHIRTDILKEKRAEYGDQIFHSLSAKLSWTHPRRIIYLDDPVKRDFYAEMCRLEQWSVRTLNDNVQSMLFERTALSKKPDKKSRTSC